MPRAARACAMSRCSIIPRRLGLLAGTFWLASTAITWASDGTPMIDPGVRAAVNQGAARVLVELQVADGTRPEAELPTAEAVTRQRAAIAAAQQAVVSRLVATRFSVLRQYTVVPMMALEIGADALAVLERAGNLVTRIRLDSTRMPVSP